MFALKRVQRYYFLLRIENCELRITTTLTVFSISARVSAAKGA